MASTEERLSVIENEIKHITASCGEIKESLKELSTDFREKCTTLEGKILLAEKTAEDNLDAVSSKLSTRIWITIALVAVGSGVAVDQLPAILSAVAKVMGGQ